MRLKHKEILTTTLGALALAFFLARFLAISQRYPFYFIYDMDHIVTMDTLLINSGLLPDHINHPCFGMYLLQALSERVAHAFGVVSAISLKELSTALNPLSAVAELTTYLRQQTAFIEILLVIFLWSALRLITRPGRWISLLFLLLLGMQESLIYHASMIRTELYAIFFWSGALLLMAIAVNARSRRVPFWSLLGSGVLLGLCFLTKIQSLFHVAAYVPLTILALTMASRQSTVLNAPLTRKGGRTMAIVATVNLAIFLLLILGARAVEIPKDMGIFTKSFEPNPLTFLFGLMALGLAAAQWFYYKKGRTDAPECRYLNLFTLVWTGFLAAFLLHFLVFARPATSLLYLLYDFKMVFYRELSSQQKLEYIIIDPKEFFYYHPVMFGVNLALLFFLIVGAIEKVIAVRPWQVVLCGLLTALALVLPKVGVRYFTRDLLWEEILINVLNCYFFMLIWRGAKRFGPALRVVISSLLLLFFVVETAHALVMPRRIDMNCNQYGWWIDRWRYSVYDHNQKGYYQKLMERYSGPMWIAARPVAREQEWVRRMAAFVFQNQPVTHRELGFVSEDFPVWTNNLDYTIADFSPILRDAIVFDSMALPLRPQYFSKEKYVEVHSEYLDKFKPAPGNGLLSVLTRADLQVLLFVQPADLETQLSPQMAPTDLAITLQKGNEKILMQGIEVKNYAELPVGALKKDYFFVIVRRR